MGSQRAEEGVAPGWVPAEQAGVEALAALTGPAPASTGLSSSQASARLWCSRSWPERLSPGNRPLLLYRSAPTRARPRLYRCPGRVRLHAAARSPPRSGCPPWRHLCLPLLAPILLRFCQVLTFRPLLVVSARARALSGSLLVEARKVQSHNESRARTTCSALGHSSVNHMGAASRRSTLASRTLVPVGRTIGS